MAPRYELFSSDVVVWGYVWIRCDSKWNAFDASTGTEVVRVNEVFEDKVLSFRRSSGGLLCVDNGSDKGKSAFLRICALWDVKKLSLR